MTATQKYYLSAGIVVLAVLAGTIVAYPQLPSTVPLHWDAHGNVNGWGPKWQLFLTGPGLLAGLIAMFSVIPWLSPKKFEVDTFRETYLYIMIVVVAMIAYIHIVVLMAALGVRLDITRAIEGCVCLLITLLGNVMGKVRRNFYVGVRTPWTIANERVWNATHRFAAKTCFAAGFVGLIAVFLRAPFWLPIAAIMAGVLTPAVYSLVFYKQLERHGQLN